MIAGYVVGFPIFDDSSPTSVSRSCPAMVVDLQIEKAGCTPAEHISLDFIHGVRAGPHPQAVDCVPARATIDLCATSNVKRRVTFQYLLAVFNVIQKPAANAESRALLKLLKCAFKIFGLERQVSVELAHEFPVPAGKSMEPVVERFDNPRTPLAKSPIVAV